MPRSLAMIVVMPIVGRLYNKISPRAVIAFGILLFAYTAWLMGKYTLATSARGVVNVLILQGAAFACLFIPLTTLALSSIPRHRLTDASGLNSLFRQTGGSMGLAIFATYLSRFTTQIHGQLTTHISPDRAAAMDRFSMLQRSMMARGMDPESARMAAARMIDLGLTQQAMMLAFQRLFLIAGISFLCVLPLVFLLKSNPGAEKVDVHVEM
jgi:DHA2 family multidrug resistance protein